MKKHQRSLMFFIGASLFMASCASTQKTPNPLPLKTPQKTSPPATNIQQSSGKILFKQSDVVPLAYEKHDDYSVPVEISDGFQAEWNIIFTSSKSNGRLKKNDSTVAVIIPAGTIGRAKLSDTKNGRYARVVIDYNPTTVIFVYFKEQPDGSYSLSIQDDKDDTKKIAKVKCGDELLDMTISLIDPAKRPVLYQDFESTQTKNVLKKQ